MRIVAYASLLGGCYASHSVAPSEADAGDAGLRDGGDRVGDGGPTVCEGLPEAHRVVHMPPPGRACGSSGIGSVELFVPAREHENLEQAALVATDGIVAEQRDYDRLVRDVPAIAIARSELEHVDYRAPYERALELRVDLETARQMEAGAYRAWDCLNGHYPVDAIDVSFPRHGSFARVAVVFSSVFAIELVAPEYERLPGVTSVSARSGGIDGSGFCFVPDGDRWHYLYAAGSGDCASGCIEREYFYLTTERDGTVEPRATWKRVRGEAPPCWFSLCDPYDPYGLGT